MRPHCYRKETPELTEYGMFLFSFFDLDTDSEKIIEKIIEPSGWFYFLQSSRTVREKIDVDIERIVFEYEEKYYDQIDRSLIEDFRAVR